ncbi:MAG: HupE/UreJ family protein [Gammaproteobacteria bacterium]|jgi:hypothetical protein|nr:HupE/UreJ family protein [Gammaproteobacteria bacterium]
MSIKVQSFMAKICLFVCMALVLFFAAIFGMIPDSLAHAVTEGDKGYIQETTGVHPIPFLYLGAKHMMTGYDHLLFLFGVVFFLYHLKDVITYVTLFAIGHVITLVSGVLLEISVNAYLIEVAIAFSLVYIALNNMGAFERWLGFQPSTKIATFIFGLCHGFGLATKFLDYEISPHGLLPNLIAFNVGIEFGQVLALAVILILMGYWRRSSTFVRYAYTTNTALMTAGFLLIGFHATAFYTA